MKKFLLFLILIWLIVLPVSALEFEAPPVPDEGRKWMPENTESFGHAVYEMLKRNLLQLSPEFENAAQVSKKVLCIVLLTSALQMFTGSCSAVCSFAGVVSIAATLLSHVNTMIFLGVDTIHQISDYAKLLLPVMTGAMAAQGGISTSAALYAGTALFNAVLSNLIRTILVPGVYLYLAISIVNSAVEEDMLKRIGELIKNGISWLLKTLLMVFTSYLGLTGVVSGTTDAAALKAAKLTISSFVPVVGSILSDASESVLVGVGLMKNTAGVYGILAVLAVFIHPFLRIGVHYIFLKIVGSICSIFGNKAGCRIIESFSTAMGILLGMTAGCCLMVLVSTVCFMKGVQ